MSTPMSTPSYSGGVSEDAFPLSSTGFGMEGGSAGLGALQANANIGLFQVPIAISSLNPTGGAGGAGGSAWSSYDPTAGADSIISGPITIGGNGGGGGGASIFGKGTGGASGGSGGGNNISETNILAPPPLPNMMPFQSTTFPSGSLASIPGTPYTPANGGGGFAPNSSSTAGELLPQGGGPSGPNFLPAMLGQQQDGTSGGSPWITQGPQGNGGSGAPPPQTAPTLPEILSGRNLPQVAGTPRGMVGMSPSGSPMLSGNVSAIEQAQTDPQSIIAKGGPPNPYGNGVVPPPPAVQPSLLDTQYGDYPNQSPKAILDVAKGLQNQFIKPKKPSLSKEQRNAAYVNKLNNAEKRAQMSGPWYADMLRAKAVRDREQQNVNYAERSVQQYQRELANREISWQNGGRDAAIQKNMADRPFMGYGSHHQGIMWRNSALNNPEKYWTESQWVAQRTAEVDAAHQSGIAAVEKAADKWQNLKKESQANLQDAEKEYKEASEEYNKRLDAEYKTVQDRANLDLHYDTELDENERSDERLGLEALQASREIVKDEADMVHKQNLLKSKDAAAAQNAQLRQYTANLERAKVQLASIKHDDYQSRVKLLDYLATQNMLSNRTKALAAALMGNPKALTNEAVQSLFDSSIGDMSHQMDTNNTLINNIGTQLNAAAPPGASSNPNAVTPQQNSEVGNWAETQIRNGNSLKDVNDALASKGFKYDNVSKTVTKL